MRGDYGFLYRTMDRFLPHGWLALLNAVAHSAGRYSDMVSY